MAFNMFKNKGEEEVDLSQEKTKDIPPITAPPPPQEVSTLPNLKPAEEEKIAPHLITPPKLVPIEEKPVNDRPKTEEPKPSQPEEKPAAPAAEKPATPPKFPSPHTPRIPPEKKIIQDRPLPTATRSLFVKVSDYKAILDCTNVIKGSIKEAENIILRLNELKNEEDKAFEIWRNQLEDIQRKLTYIDKSVFEAG